jgi:MFS superfamily sulfate permease-like transporter
MHFNILLFVKVGVFLFTIGLLRFGFLDNIISRPLLCGFVNAVALLIWISQLVRRSFSFYFPRVL